MVNAHGLDRSEGTASIPGAEGTPWTSAVCGVDKKSVGTAVAWLDLQAVLLRSITRYETCHSSKKAALIGYVPAWQARAWMNGGTGN
jgi:hypothetical protein